MIEYQSIAEEIDGHQCVISTSSFDDEATWTGRFAFTDLGIRGEVSGLGSSQEAAEAAKEAAKNALANDAQ